MIEDKKTIIITRVENISEEGQEQSKPAPDFAFVPVMESYHTEKKKKKLSLRFVMLLTLMLLALGTGALIYTLTNRDAGASGVTGSKPSQPSSLSVPASGSSVSELSQSGPESSAKNTPPETGSAFESALDPVSAESAAEPDLPPHDPLTPPEGYDYALPVPETAAQEESWFDDAVFVGNSRTQGLLLYTGMGTKCYADVGLTVETVFTAESFTDPAPDPEAEEPVKITAAQALERDDYRKVYLMFGINELGWSREDVFIRKYAALIDTVAESHPDAQVYIQSILPVSAEKYQETSYLTNERIGEFNAQLQQMAQEKNVFYLDVAAAFRDENNALPEELSNDGVHLKKDGCITWKEYLLTHSVTSETPKGDASETSSEPKYAEISIPSIGESDETESES